MIGQQYLQKLDITIVCFDIQIQWSLPKLEFLIKLVTFLMTEDQMKACLVFDIHVLPQFQSQRWPNSKFNNISNFHTFSTLKNNEKYIVQSESTALLSTTCKFGSKWSNFIHSSTNSKVKDTFDSIINYGSERVDFFKKCKSTHVTVACGQPG